MSWLYTCVLLRVWALLLEFGRRYEIKIGGLRDKASTEKYLLCSHDRKYQIPRWVRSCFEFTTILTEMNPNDFLFWDVSLFTSAFHVRLYPCCHCQEISSFRFRAVIYETQSENKNDGNGEQTTVFAVHVPMRFVIARKCGCIFCQNSERTHWLMVPIAFLDRTPRNFWHTRGIFRREGEKSKISEFIGQPPSHWIDPRSLYEITIPDVNWVQLGRNSRFKWGAISKPLSWYHMNFIFFVSPATSFRRSGRVSGWRS